MCWVSAGETLRWRSCAEWNSSVADGSMQTLRIARNSVQEDWQWPWMRNS